MENFVSDKFNADFDMLFGYTPTTFKLDGEREPRSDMPRWRINRQNAKSKGALTFMHTKPCRSCGGLKRYTFRVYSGTKINKCFGCN
jgi:hypothetical protein